ncbi:uncharacterized protein DUF2489 [Pseudomonas sp. URMO17WK12:I1]|uniref:DUF2489 domain-containing protein n=1 Tax=unclassified Pseudomonas TaxID=196821 RepID=UPI0004898956|nr:MULTISPECIES: DUF2489 domain-containing protein [unclassified Pseudomonas]PZW67611.1 uncharacterized protein DUF2489 [Pseudomonas sp. URMO17WK12:I1]
MGPDRLLILLAVLIVGALAFYAAHLWRQVWARQRQQAEVRLAQRQRLHDDLRVLASSLLDGQLPLIEGAIRIKVLLDNYDSALTLAPQTQVFQQLYDATAHVPTHADWQALSRAERRQHEARFAELTEAHEQQAREAARWLLDTGLVARP